VKRFWPALCLLFVSGIAGATEALWYLDLPISQVSLEAPDGGLPPENLEPLLRNQQGEMLGVRGIRDDLAMLYGTGLFAEVEAHVRPWVGFDENGDPRDEVWLTYRVIAATVVADWDINGNDNLADRELALAAGLALGDRFLVEEDGPRLIRFMQSAYARKGYPAAHVELVSTALGEGQIRLSIEVEEGPPRLLEALQIAPSRAVSSWRMRRIVKRSGLHLGSPFTGEKLEAAREALEQAHRENGWLEARVNAVLGAKNVRHVSFLIETGPKIRFISEIEGMDERALRESLGVREDERLRVSDLDDGRERLEQSIREKGWIEAEVRLVVALNGDRKTVRVSENRGPQYRFEKLLFEGSTLFDSSFLAAAVQESSPEILGRGRVHPDAVEKARESLVDLVAARGHLQVHVKASLQVTDRSESTVDHVLTFRFDEGPLVRLKSLVFEGVVEDLEPMLQAYETELLGAVVDHSRLDPLVAELVETHREWGYLGAKARIRRSLNPEGSEAQIKVIVDAGIQTHLRYVLVRGNRKTLRHIIEEAILLEVGAPISPSLLGETRRKLYGLDLFSTVEIRLEGEDERFRDLVVQVRENPSLAIELGGGVATDLGVRGFSRITRRNILGLGHTFSAIGQLGVGYEGEAWRLDTSAPEWRAALRYEAPRFPSPSVESHVDLLLRERVQEPTYRLGRTGGAFGMQLGGVESGFQLAMGYRFFGHWLQDVDPGAFVIGDPWLSVLDVSQAEDVQAALPGGPRWESGPTVLAIWDRRNDRFNPTEGTLMSMQFQLTDPGVAEQITFRAEGQVQSIVPVGPVRFQVEVGGGFGWAQGRSTTLALENRFRMGGANSLRGFSLDTVGPKNRVAISDLYWPSQLAPVVEEVFRQDPIRWVPTGGDSMLRASLEMWTPLEVLHIPAPGTSLVAFVDAGNVYFRDPTILATSTIVDPEPVLRIGAGLGLRLATPVGPVQVDWGINPAYFTQTWAQERGEEPWRLHLSLGSL
jgi:outer membrane protein assembly complex protein YaeT